MKAQDIEVGVTYAWARYGVVTSGDYPTRITDDEPMILRAVPIAPPKDGRVECEVTFPLLRRNADDERGHEVLNEVCRTRDLMGTWGQREAGRKRNREARIIREREDRDITRRMKAVLGPDVYAEHASRIDHERNGRMYIGRATLATLLEAAFEAGQNSED